MSGLTVKIRGLEETKAALKALPVQLQRRVVRPALTKASKPMLLAARRLAPRDTKALAKSLIRKMKTYTQSGNILAVIAPKKQETLMLVRKGSYSKKPQRVNPAYYAHLVHGGTRSHSLQKEDKLARTGAMNQKREVKRSANMRRWAADLQKAKTQAQREKILAKIERSLQYAVLNRTEKQTEGAKRHPGTKPNPFLIRAFEQTRGQVQSIFIAEVRSGIARAQLGLKSKKGK